jgi:hypothetical protein
MDSTVKARFFQVENARSGPKYSDKTFFEVIHELWDDPNREKYVEIYGGARVRIEHFCNDTNEVGRGFIDGELVRQQIDNIPPIALQGRPLTPNSDPLGHRCAFRYHAGLNVLLLESRKEAVTPLRLDALVKAKINKHGGFHLSPVLSPSALRHLKNGTPRSVNFRVARPSDMNVVENDKLGIEDNLSNLANVYGGPNVEVKVGWPRGDKDGVLSLKGIENTIKWAMGNRSHVEKLSVKIAEEPDAIDIFSEQLKESATLDLHNSDVVQNYAARRQFLADSFNRNLLTLRKIYGQ